MRPLLIKADLSGGSGIAVPAGGNSLASGWNLADQLVYVQLTNTLADTQLDLDDNSISRSAAIARILDQPAPYPKDYISTLALQTGADKAMRFVRRRGSITSLIFRGRAASSDGAGAHRPLRTSLSGSAVAAAAAAASMVDGRASTRNSFSVSIDRRASLREVASSRVHSAGPGSPSDPSPDDGWDQLSCVSDASGGASLSETHRARATSPSLTMGSAGSSGSSAPYPQRMATPGPSSPAPIHLRGKSSAAVGLTGSIQSMASGSSAMGIENSMLMKDGWLTVRWAAGPRDGVYLWCILDETMLRAFDSQLCEQLMVQVDLAVSAWGQEGVALGETHRPLMAWSRRGDFACGVVSSAAVPQESTLSVESTTAFAVQSSTLVVTFIATDEADLHGWLQVFQEMHEMYGGGAVSGLLPRVAASGGTADLRRQSFSRARERAMAAAGGSDARSSIYTSESDQFSADIERLLRDMGLDSDTDSSTGPPRVLEARIASTAATAEPPTLQDAGRDESVDNFATARGHVSIRGQHHMVLYPRRGNDTQDEWIELSETEMQELELVGVDQDDPAGVRRGGGRGQGSAPEAGGPSGSTHAIHAFFTVAMRVGNYQGVPRRNSKRYRRSQDNAIYRIKSEPGRPDTFVLMAATLDTLVARLANELHPDRRFIDTFLLGYRHVMSADQLMKRLLMRFNVAPPIDATEEEADYYRRWVGIIKIRTIGVVKRWVELYYEDIARNAAAREYLEQLLDSVPQFHESLAALASQLRQLVDEQEVAFQAYSAPPASQTLAYMGRAVDMLNIDPGEFAQQLALADHSHFASIRLTEFAIRLWEGNGPSTRNLSKTIEWFNSVGMLVASTVRRQTCAGWRGGARACLTDRQLRCGSLAGVARRPTDLPARLHQEAGHRHQKVYPRRERERPAAQL